MNVVCFLLGDSPASEFYMPTFRNILFDLHRRIGIRLWRWNRQSVPKRRHIKFWYWEITNKRAYNSKSFLTQMSLQQRSLSLIFFFSFLAYLPGLPYTAHDCNSCWWLAVPTAACIWVSIFFILLWFSFDSLSLLNIWVYFAKKSGDICVQLPTNNI